MSGERGTEAVAAALGWSVVRRCRGGEFGATLVQDRDCRRAILKAMPDSPPWSEGWAASVDLVERLRATGYPAPRYLANGVVAGHLYTVQEEVAGAVPRPLTERHARQLLVLAERQAGLGEGSPPAGVPEWTSYVHAELDGTIRSERAATARSAHPESARLLDEVRALGRRLAGLVLPGGDIVHGDFHHQNVLADGDRITAVIDWEQAARGDWRYDAFWLAFWCQVHVAGVEPAAARVVRERVAGLLTPAELAAYAGVAASRVLSLFAHHRPEVVPAAIGWCQSHLAPFWR
jgi:aminoglycoside phosphotransferase (APT) family kinase protein